jgi:hypothetical protein
MAAPAAALPAGAHDGDEAAPDGAASLHSVLTAAETAVLTACAVPSALASLHEKSALRHRVGTLLAALGTLRDALETQEAGGSASGRGEPVTFAALPHSLLVSILSALPADGRPRCAEVCRSWRAAVADRALWQRVDLSPGGGVTRPVTAALLRAVAARAGGGMQALMLCSDDEDLIAVALPDVLKETTLQELDIISETMWAFDDVETLLVAAQQLCVLRCSVTASFAEAVRLLGGDALFRPLQLRSLFLDEERDEDEDEALARPDDADVHAFFAAGLQRQASMERLELVNIPLSMPALLDAVVDAALARRWKSLKCWFCELSPASAGALARLLRNSTALELLHVHGNHAQLLDGPAAALLADALRANTTLRVLHLIALDLWEDVDAGIAVVRALTAHPSLRELSLSVHRISWHAAAVGSALGAPIAVDAPALHTLDVSGNWLGDAGLAPLLEALPRSTHLRVLRCGDNGMRGAFACDCLLPAIRANASLRELDASTHWGGELEGMVPFLVLEAEALVRARAEAGDAVD